MLDKELTKPQVAKMSGVPFWSIDGYYQDKRQINTAPLETLIKLSLALDCKIEDIIDDADRVAKIKKLLKPINIKKVL